MGVYQLRKINSMHWAHTLLLSLVAITACNPRGPSVQPKEIAQLRLNLQGEPRSLDPRRGDRRSQILLRMLFESLTRVGPDNKVQPAMAEKIEIDEAKRTYTFTLRPAYWSNGQPVVAADFELAWKEMCAPDFDSPFAFVFYPIKNAEAAKSGRVGVDAIGVTAVDQRTLIVELQHPAPYFLYLISSPLFSPVCRAVFGDPRWSSDAGEKYISNGPFMLQQWRHGEEVVVEKNPRYWDASHVALERVTVSMVEDPATALELFEQGELDWAGEPLSELPLSSFDRLRQEGRLHSCLAGGIFQLKFDVEQGPLRSAAFRRALACAINRRELADHILRGGEQVATTILPPSLALGGGDLVDDDAPQARRELQVALQELGCNLEDLAPIKLSYATIEGHKALAQAIQHQWQETLGIKIQLDGMEWNSFFASMWRGEVQIGGAPWYSWHDDPIYNLSHVRSKTARYNSTHWDHADYKALLDAADTEMDLDKRRGFLQEAERLVLHESPLVPLYVTTFKYVADERLEGVFISELGHIDFKWAHWRAT
jgi:oligopeptide transport system substrate-binding protein